MARGKAKASKRGRGRPAASSHAKEETIVLEPLAKKKRGGKHSKTTLEQQQLEEERAKAEAELQEQMELEAFQQQVMDDHDDSQSSSGATQKKKKRPSGRPRKVELTDETPQEELTVPLPVMDEEQSCGLHMTTMQIKALANLVACKDCGESVTLAIRPTTKGMISEFVVGCTVCEAKKVTITPNLVRERKRKREIKGLVLQKTENINYAHVAAFLDNGLGYSGLRHYCKYFNARCLNEATFIVYARQVIQDVVNDTEDNLQSNARIVRKVYDAGLDEILDITVSYTTTYHQWGSDFCLVAGAVIELQTGLVLDYDVANMYCHVCKINAKRIISMTPTEMTDWFNKHQSSCEIREWCDELDHDAEEGVKDIEPKYLECFVAKKIWSRSVEKFGFRYSTLIHESDETIHNELLRAAPYGDALVMIDDLTNCFSRRKSEHARTAFQNKLKSKCPRERVQTKDRIMYVYAMSIPEYNRFAVGSNIKLRELVRRMEVEENEAEGFTLQVLENLPTIQAQAVIPADGDSSEIVYTQVHGDGAQEGMQGTEEEELYNIQREVERMEGETEQYTEEGEYITDEQVMDEEEDGTVASTSSKDKRRIKTEVKRENIVMEAVDDMDEETAEYEMQTSVSDTIEAGPSNSDAPVTSVTSDSSEQQIIVVTEGSSTPVATTVSSDESNTTEVTEAEYESNSTTATIVTTAVVAGRTIVAKAASTKVIVSAPAANGTYKPGTIMTTFAAETTFAPRTVTSPSTNKAKSSSSSSSENPAAAATTSSALTTLLSKSGAPSSGVTIASKTATVTTAATTSKTANSSR